ncbi:DUF4870 domain-containing protein [Tenuifilum thalassicum]|uniref:DUF4870 domain-containing protein n=1 Tax=Tenuifilum thalassicum TaxID=2590900 RepID=A0A7D3XKV2_9BACT|nr:DUF4870 domain-containing protein [Tenuifilum thalassicum]QKG80030.1 DUF4870 domain-containing protein [Tenuifilum thalassicum]
MEFYPIPQPDEVSDIEKDDAMGAYFMMFATTGLGLPLPIINLIASIIYYYLNRSKGRFVQFHSLQSLYSQIPVTLLNSALVIWAIINLVNDTPFTNTFWGLVITAGIFNIIYFIFSIIAAVKAKKGRFFYFLFFGKLAYIQAYKKMPTNENVKVNLNKPPL